MRHYRIPNDSHSRIVIVEAILFASIVPEIRLNYQSAYQISISMSDASSLDPRPLAYSLNKHSCESKRHPVRNGSYVARNYMTHVKIHGEDNHN